MNASAISREAAGLREKYPGAAPSEIASALGVQVRMKTLGRLKGLYIFLEDIGYILINSGLSEQEREMAIAHELGHDRLHRNASKDASFSDSMLFDAKGRAEFEANLFASELMIGDESVLGSAMDCYSLARSLSVYPQLMLFKLYSMNSRGYDIPMPEDCRAGFLAKNCDSPARAELLP